MPLDSTINSLCGVRGSQAVRRNLKRFPADFLFQLTESEAMALVSQSVIPDIKRLGGALPFAFTEQGVTMLSSILRFDRAIDVNIAIMRTFGQLRRMMDSNRELSRKVSALERKYDE